MSEYITPELTIIEFDTEDVITTSNTNNGKDDGGFSFPIIPLN